MELEHGETLSEPAQCGERKVRHCEAGDRLTAKNLRRVLELIAVEPAPTCSGPAPRPAAPGVGPRPSPRAGRGFRPRPRGCFSEGNGLRIDFARISHFSFREMLIHISTSRLRRVCQSRLFIDTRHGRGRRCQAGETGEQREPGQRQRGANRRRVAHVLRS